MGTMSIQEATTRITSGKVLERTAGLKDLIHILKHNRGKSSLESLSNKAYNSLCETLFKCMLQEKSSWIQSKSKSVKAAANLPLCATALRQTIIVGVRTFKNATVEAILENIAEALPLQGKSTLVKPLLEDLPKALRTLLEYQPHIERLSAERWDAAVDFCISSLSSLFVESEIGGDSSLRSTGRSNSQARTPLDAVDGTSFANSRDSMTKSRPIPDGLIHTAEDFMICLQLLVQPSNAPVIGKSEVILSTLVECLRRRIGRGYPAALAAINSVIARTKLHSVELTKRTIKDILPMVKSYWSNAVLRDELLIILMQTESHICSILSSKNEETAFFDLETVVETLYGDYRRRQETAAFQYLEDDHISFRNIGKAASDSHPLNTYAFSLGLVDRRCEGLWETTSLIARFSFMLDSRKRMNAQTREEGDDMPLKKLRITHHFQEYLRHVSEPRSNAKRAALQVVAFMIQEGPLSEDDLQDVLEKLTPFIADENSVHATWAMIGLTAAAFQSASTNPALLPYWISAWQSASRAFTSMSSSRTACHLMDILLRLRIVPFSAVSEIVRSMLLSIEIAGPALVTESSSSLLVTLLRERTAENPTYFDTTADRILYWLFSKWTPSLFPDRVYASLNAHHCNARDVLRVLHSCLDKPLRPFKASPFIVLGPVGQARAHAAQYRELIHYLLLLDTPDGFRTEPDEMVFISESPTSGDRPAQLEASVLDFCILETEKIKQRWKEWSREKERGITSDMMRIITNFCFAASAMASTANPVSTRLAKFVPALESLIRSFASFLSRREVDQYKADAVLEVLSQLLPDITSLGALDNEVFKGLGALPLAHHLSQALDGRKSTKESFYTEDDDFMDVDEPTNSQLAGGAPNTDIEVPRHDLLARTNTLSLRSSCALYLRLISTLADLPSDEDNQDQIPVEFIHYVVSLPEPDLLHSRQVIDALFSGRFILQKAACQDLFQRISERLIDPRAREYNTSEISHSMMVRILTGTSQIWCEPNDDESQELYENAEDLYAYYVKEMEKGGVRRSPNLQRTMVDLLIGLFMARPNFGNARKAPSVRTSLYEILDRGDIVAQYHIAQNLPRIFETYVLAQHERVFEDIQASLPHDPTWTEGIAIRVLVLSRLASRWYTLVRICVYGIFETAGMIETATKHAKRCTLEVARARQLEGPQTLFKLFAPQIIFSWLSTGAMDKSRHIADIPFSIFQYDTLADLLRDVEAEAIGQAVMFANREEVEYVARTLGTTAADALNKNFSRAAAYALAYDTCRGSQRNQSIASSIKLLSSLVGGEQFSSLMQEHFPRVLGIMLQTTAYEDKFEKALAKRPAFIATAKALAEMTKLQHSDDGERYQVFQPCFTAAYLFDLLDRLCRRANKDASNFWTASLYTFVMRMLLNRIHPALGSLYARSVIRKIRILVALAGEVAHKDYPLQMTLQSLRPFLTDVHCAEDTLGIMQYLFAHGTLYLGSELSFVTGISLSVLISIRAFLGSSQDSTTQESQYTTTKNKTQTFHSWFTRYLVNYADSLAAGKQFSSSYIKAFRSITTAASRVRTEGNSLRGTEESKLLLELLDDVRSRRHLLNPQSREVALDLLCQNFLPAPSSGDDVLGADADVAKYASQVWQSCQRSGVGDGYLLWAARVLGRTFSAHGELSRISSQSRSWPSQTHKSKDSPARCSRIAIVQKLLDLRLSDNREEVGLAEDGIRLILRRISDEEAVDLDNIVPRHIADALLFMSLDEDRYDNLAPKETLEQVAYSSEREEVSLWVKDLAAALCHVGSGDSILGSLSRIIQGIDGMAEKMLPYILHLVLLREIDADREVRKTMSAAYSSWFQEFDSGSRPYIKILIDCVLYLRTQKLPKEVTRVDRDKWLEVDFLLMAEAATACGMYKSALLFAETYGSQPIVISSSRRHSTLAPPPQIPTELQISIYKNLDEPDSYYGVEQESSLFSVLERLDYEGDGVKSLLFRGARMDSQMRRLNTIDPPDSRGTVKSLIMLNMNSVTQSLLSNDQFRNLGDETVESTLYTARKLGQWDIRAPEGNHSEASTLFKAFQGIHYASDALMARKQLDRQFLATMKSLAQTDRYSNLMKVPLRTLAVLNEADEVVSCTTPDQLLDCWDQMKARQKWMIAGQFDDVRILLSSRETLFSVISTNSALLESLRARPGTIRQMEVEALVSSSTICRKHGALQESLSSVTYLSDLVEKCRSVGLDIEVTAQHEVSSVLWEQGEAETSIRMRQRLIKNTTLDSQKIDISLPVLLAKLGHHLAEARLEQPESIIQEYLEPAIKELKGQTQGPGPGQVFHEYALFCDKQLQNPDAVEDLTRMKILMERKKQEATEFQKLGSVEKNKVVREGYKRAYSRALNWYKLDKIEYERLHSSRENFLKQCLENYLLSLQASDEYNTDVLRVFALWLEYSDTPLANKAVGHYLSKVPSGKFALLMNQLSSRLQAETTDFQRLLSELVFRICTEHPYHGMHQIFAMQNSVASKEDAVRSKDESSKSRQRAATHIAQLLGSDKRARSFWNIISQSDECYHNLAMSKNDQTRMGREIALDKMPEAKELLRKIPHLNVPPATLTIEIRANCDYTDVPKITGFKPRMSIANGLSAPKIISAIGSDGNYYKQLFKSGNDDLRQDAIMEQVFDQVSRLLKNHTATRLRNLGIRTYKVLPLSTRSGLMEFVPNTIPLHSYLIPAHEHYYPNDWKSDKCRKDIMNCSSESQATRVKVWQKIAANFHPIMRYFFIERFEDPDEWFEKRLAYTRSTAAISILGHVLGLGDRHCHNILLDEKSGEVVHIDLGVAFEAGRLLPVPEVVPFRLTRDLVDGMGYTKTEGVFRRCCEFTMDTLREERESIMTLLNVLRYDPLVNWSVTPTKAKRMQEGQDTAAQNEGRAAQVTTGALDEIAGESSKKREEQAGEAGRALSVVEKKLSKTLSTRATVNELIQTATDERNLAVLYAGWASYC